MQRIVVVTGFLAILVFAATEMPAFASPPPLPQPQKTANSDPVPTLPGDELQRAAPERDGFPSRLVSPYAGRIAADITTAPGAASATMVEAHGPRHFEEARKLMKAAENLRHAGRFYEARWYYELVRMLWPGTVYDHKATRRIEQLTRRS